MQEFKAAYQGGTDEYVEKKSRFIGTMFPVSSEEEANAYIEEYRKKYWDARHNCYAYVIGDNNEISRCTDDGEPSGTAGRPMLEVILGQQVHNVLVIVTRYFGGVLLGTGGLVRAYTKATQLALEAGTIIEKKKGVLYEVFTDYTGLGKMQYIVSGLSAFIQDTVYEADVKLYILVDEQDAQKMEKQMIEATSGKVEFGDKKEVVYSIVENEVILFE